MIEKDDLFEAENKLYVVFDELEYEGNDYCFCNEMVDKKTFGRNFTIFQNYSDGIEKVEDQELLNKLLPLFSNKVNIEIYNGFHVDMGEE